MSELKRQKRTKAPSGHTTLRLGGRRVVGTIGRFEMARRNVTIRLADYDQMT